MNRVPIFVWFLVPTLLIVIAGAWFLSSNPMDHQDNPDVLSAVSNPVEGVVEFDISGRQHIQEGAAASDHNSNPPTSGQHWPSPEKNGIFDQPLAGERVIHNLEHGFIWISYKPDTPTEVVDSLKNIVNEDNWKVIMTPRTENDSQIALAAWGRLLKMDEPDYQKIREFIKTYRNRGPEKTPN